MIIGGPGLSTGVAGSIFPAGFAFQRGAAGLGFPGAGPVAAGVVVRHAAFKVRAAQVKPDDRPAQGLQGHPLGGEAHEV